MKLLSEIHKSLIKTCRSGTTLAILCLSIILIGAFFYLFGIILADEVTTTNVHISERSGNLRVTPDSKVTIRYVPGEQDEITFFLAFENLGGEQLAGFNIMYDGEMKNKDIIDMRGIKEVSLRKLNGDTIRYYDVDFQKAKTAVFFQRFYCNMFRDKFGEVRLNLFLTGSDKEIFNDVPIYFVGIDQFNFERAHPMPEREYMHAIRYLYSVDNESFLNGIMLRGSNPAIERKFQVGLFIFGAIIAVSTSALTTLVIDSLRRKGHEARNT